MIHPFDRSGIAALSDLQTPQWRELFSRLESEQAEFLAREADFRSPEYVWPRDPLHNWSRIWEYPYVFHQLLGFHSTRPDGRALRLADVGSGVTFFPFSAARLGFDVSCADIDPVCGRDIPRAAKVLSPDPRQVEFRLIRGDRLPFVDGELDVVVCISVLEHIPAFENTIAEMARALKRDGLLVLTIDLDLRGDFEIGVARHRQLVDCLEHFFLFEKPDRTVHPANQLTSGNGPFGTAVPGLLRRSWFESKQRIKRVLGLPPRLLIPFVLSVQGFVMRKRD